MPFRDAPERPTPTGSKNAAPVHSRIKTAALDPFRGFANAIRDELPEAITVLDAFHVVKLGSAMVNEGRRVQQDTLGLRGRMAIRSTGSAGPCRIGAEHLTEKQASRLDAKLTAGTRITKSPSLGSATRNSATSTTLARKHDRGTRDRRDRSFPSLPDP